MSKENEILDISDEEKLLGDAEINELKVKQNKLKVKEAIAKRGKAPQKITNREELYKILGVNEAKKKLYSPDAVYKVCNLNQGTETFVNGEQAESIKGYTDDYVVEFDHIMI